MSLSIWGDSVPIIENNLPLQIINTYGPTECSDLATTYTLTKEDILSRKTVPVGKALPNISVYVLDLDLNLVPLGGVGELHIGGIGIGGGYINAPDLTAERFIPNPFVIEEKLNQGINNLLLYKTGILFAVLCDGNIEFLGRIDEQVKLRGFRIELAEIETILNKHEDIIQTTVIVRLDGNGNKKIVAYLVPKEITQGLLEKHLQITTSSGKCFSIFKGEHVDITNTKTHKSS